VVAIHTEPTPVDLMAAFWKELALSGARVYQREDFDTAVELLSNGVIHAASLITDVVPLAEVEHAFQRLASGGKTLKVLVDSR
jgi:threonine dehydrogenase-like Zn-dependent dehydrogenase